VTGFHCRRLSPAKDPVESGWASAKVPTGRSPPTCHPPEEHRTPALLRAQSGRG
jgi:hypothetical protein